jgi:putative endopeptidase
MRFTSSSAVLFIILTFVALNLDMATSMDATDSSIGSGQEGALDLGNMNLSAKPGDDFYEHVNGAWIKNNPVPPDKVSYGPFIILRDVTYEQAKEIVLDAANNTTAPEGSLEQKVGMLYRVGMDNETIEKQGRSPIKGELDLIENISSASDVQKVSSHLLDYGIDPFFSLFSAPDNKNSNVMIATLSQGGLGLPDRDFYFRQDNKSNLTREQYLAHISKMFSLLGDDNETALKNAKTVLRMETRLANASFTNVEDMDVVKTYNIMSTEELQAFAPGIDWDQLFSYVGCPEVKKVNIRNPFFFKELSTALSEESVDDWKTFLRWNLISAMAGTISSNYQEEQFDFYGRKLNGQQQMKPRWKRVLDAEYGAVGEAIGRIYVERYFAPESKAKMQEMIENLKKSFSGRIRNLSWMEPETKQKALEKLEALDVQVGYPDEWLDYSALEIKDDSYASNMLRASHFRFHMGPAGVDRIGEAVNRNIWEMSPHTVNAYADYNKNLMVFPAGILQPPFFDPKADDAVNYGAIGAIIGHEMSHNFDSEGRKFDASGNMTDWWKPTDASNFNNSTHALVDEYDHFEILPGLYINGNLTLPENIADFAGITVAYDAYKLSQEAEPEKIDGLTGDQRFFMSYAQIWRESDRDEYLRTLVLTNTHSPTKARVNGVVYNVPEFYKAFPEVSEGDLLYRPPDERPVIW